MTPTVGLRSVVLGSRDPQLLACRIELDQVAPVVRPRPFTPGRPAVDLHRRDSRAP